MRAYYPSYAVVEEPSSTRGLLVSGLLFPACAYYLLNPVALPFLDAISALLYGAGRSAIAPIGGYMPYLGGAMAQIAVPCVLIAFFFLHRYAFGLQVFTCWLGQNLVNLSLQIAKPRLLNADTPGHADWTQLLAVLDMSEYGVYIGALFFALGSLAFIAALLTPTIIRS